MSNPLQWDEKVHYITTPDNVSEVRVFQSGATRTSDLNKIDYEGFLSPEVIKRFGVYMNQHRTQADGTLRGSDNWQKGMDKEVYMKSMFRHFMEVWALHRQCGKDLDYQEEELCALLFNVSGYLFEVLRGKHG